VDVKPLININYLQPLYDIGQPVSVCSPS